MRVTKINIPFMKEPPGVVSLEELVTESRIRFGSKLWKIVFDDLEFDTPEPKLPLWFRIRKLINGTSR